MQVQRETEQFERTGRFLCEFGRNGLPHLGMLRARHGHPGEEVLRQRWHVRRGGCDQQ